LDDGRDIKEFFLDSHFQAEGLGIGMDYSLESPQPTSMPFSLLALNSMVSYVGNPLSTALDHGGFGNSWQAESTHQPHH